MLEGHKRRPYLRRALEESLYLRQYLWKYRRWVGMGLGALVVVDVLEVLPPIFLKQAVDIAVEKRPLNQLAWIAGIYFATSLIQSACRYAWRMYLIRASLHSGRDMRGGFAKHLFGLSASFFDQRRIGDLMSLATNDVEAVRLALGAGVLVFADAFFYFMTVPIAMFWLSPKLALIAFLPLPIIPFLVARNEREVHTRFEKVQEQFGKLSALAQESLNGVRVVRAFAKEDALIKRFKEAGEEYVKLNLNLARVQTAFGPTLDFTMSMGLVLLLFIGGRTMIDTQGVAITLGTFVAFQRYIQKMIWPMAALGMAVSYYQRAISSSNRLKEIFDCKTDVPDPVSSQVQVVASWKTPGGVEFNHLFFRFPNNSRDILKDITLKIEPGERIAFIGAIGGGKSALLSLLPRLYPVGRGMLSIDGTDVNDWPVEELRKQVGYVSQDVFLFSETIVENVAYGLREWMEESGRLMPSIEEATRLASVHEDVMGLTGSYRTRLGERGVNLSGGQKQRLTIARALAKQPAILVLDDALSSVDVQTEEQILTGLRNRQGRNTEIISAHRISTIRDADRIIVLEEGMIRQMGKHRQLMADRRGIYRKYYEQQQLKEDLENYSESLPAETPNSTLIPEVLQP